MNYSMEKMEQNGRQSDVLQMPNGNISTRETEVLHLIAYEHSTMQIAQKLFIAYDTAHSHRKNLFRKLQASNAAGLIRRAFELGLL